MNDLLTALFWTVFVILLLASSFVIGPWWLIAFVIWIWTDR